MGEAPTPSEMIWYFDLVSPFSYLALLSIEALARRRPILFRPVVLAALLKHWGQLGPAEIPPKRLHTYRLCQFMADKAGLPFRFPPRHPFRSLDAMRLLTAFDGQPGAVRTAFEFVWVEGRDPGDPVERDALCARLGVDDFETLITGQAKDRLRAWTDEAIDAGVFGVPSLVADSAVFWGVDALEMAEAYLDDPGMLARGEMARLANLPSGVQRRLG